MMFEGQGDRTWATQGYLIGASWHAATASVSKASVSKVTVATLNI
jgi:hypothetical protein